MTKHRLKGSMKTFGNHIDPDREEQLKWVKIGNYSPTRQNNELSLRLCNWPRMFDTALMPKRAHFKARLPALYSYLQPGCLWYTEWQLIRKIETKVKKIVKLGKSINGNRDGNLKKKSELIQLVEDFHEQYESLYSLYEDLRHEVKNNINGGDDGNSSSSSSDSESYYSPNTLSTPKSESFFSPRALSMTSNETPNIDSDQNQEREITMILKDKLTSSSEVKEPMMLSSPSRELDVALKELTVHDEESDKITRTKELEGEVASMKIEIETLSAQKRRLKEKVELRSNEAIQMMEKISRLEAQISELEVKENEFQSREDDEKRYLSEISDLSSQANTLQLEVNKLQLQKHEAEQRFSSEAEKVNDLTKKVNRLENEMVYMKSQKDEMEMENKNKSTEISKLLREMENLRNDEQRFSSEAEKVNDLTKKVNHLENELVSMKCHKDEMEMENKKKSTEISKLLQELESLRNDEQRIVEANEGLKAQVTDLEHEVSLLTAKKSELEAKASKVTHNADQSEVEKDELRGKITELEKSLSNRDHEIKGNRNEFLTQIQSVELKAKNLENALETLQNERNSLRTELETLWNDKKRLNLQFENEKHEFLQIKSEMQKKNADLSSKISDQTVEIEALRSDKKQLNSKLEKQKQDILLLEKKNSDLSNKLSDHRKNVLESDEIISKLRDELEQFHDSKIKNFQTVEKRIEETAEEFRKQFEDKYIILSRRIRVAEQLHVETKEWYLKTRTNIEEQNKDLKEREFGLKNVKDITLTANDVLVSLDSVALKFEECTANFMNRISKTSCELKFAKDWAMRKNKGLLHVKEDLDCLLSQLDDKESEILVFREKVWRSENKVRELEKMIKEKDDLMMSLKEEKREAIRQLCVWIDYHRSRSDYYKKILVSEINPKRRSAS